MKILIATPEAVPYVKTGGLADVTGALLREFRKRRIKASLVLPLYDIVRKNFKLFSTGKTLRINMGGITVAGEIWTSDRTSDPRAYFIECDSLYGRQELYGTSGGDYPDNALRFAFFSRAVIETCIAMNIKPDLIHCNDWQTGLIPLYLRTFYQRNRFLKQTATLFTIHNLGYQGLFKSSDIRFTGLGPEYFTPERLEFYGMLNFMKAGLIYSDVLSTVSRTYAAEILEKENGFGLEGVLGNRKSDLYGIPNGIDYSEWDPATDALIPAKYSMENIKGKSGCRKLLDEQAGLSDTGAPLFGVVSRLSSQKGLDLITDSVEELISLGINMIILGRGEDYYQKLLKDAEKRHRGRISVKVGFEESLAHLIYAGSDFFLMPSLYEPCGLGQLIALRYGTIPVARKTGGLTDTITDYNHLLSDGTGFLFSDYTPSAMQDAVKRALSVFVDKKKMGNLRTNAMKADFSWKKSAEDYIRIYREAVRRVAG